MLSKTSRYGMRAVLYLAANTDKDHLLGLKELAQKIEISKPMLSKTLQMLTKRALIRSKKGRNGGFYMTISQKEKDLIHVIQALEQSEHLFTECLLSQKHCQTYGQCPYRNRVANIRSELWAVYANNTILETALKLR